MLHISQCYPRKCRNQVSRKSSQMRYDLRYGPPSAWCPCGRLLFWKSPYVGWVHRETQSQMKLKVEKTAGWVQACGMSCTSTDYSMFPSSEKQPEHTQQILFPTLLTVKDWIRSSLIIFDWNIIQVKIVFHATGETLQYLAHCLKCECLIYL